MVKTFAERGIEAQAIANGWELGTHYNRPAYRFPVNNSAGQLLGYRFKFMDGQTPKNLWEGKQPENARYYFTQNAVAEIKRTQTVYVTEGEPDTLTLLAMGVENTLCWFNGAQGAPDTFFADMALLGVEKVVYIPDMDYAGLNAAKSLVETARNVPLIALLVLRVTHKMEFGVDLNDVYVENGFQLSLSKLHRWDYTELCQFVDMLKPMRKGEQLTFADKNLNPELVIQALQDHATSIGKLTSDNEQVLLPAFQEGHKSDKLGEHARFYMASAYAYDFVEGKVYSRDELIRLWNIDTSKFTRPAPSANGHSKPAQAVEPALPADFITWGDDALAKRERYLADKSIKPQYTAVRNPVPALRKYGGFAKFLRPGKIMVWMSPTGGGKTISSEMMTEELMLDGHNVMVWSSEWDTDETTDRRIQRYDGATVEQIWEDEIVRQWDYAPPEDWELTALSEQQRLKTLKVIRKIRTASQQGVRGDVAIVDSKYSFATMSQTLQWMGVLLEQAKRAGKYIPVVIFDYIQLVNQDKTSANQDEASFEQFKQFCMTHKVIGIMTSQVTKTATKAVNDGKMISSSDAQYIRADKSNLFITAQKLYHNEELVSIEHGDFKCESILQVTIDKNNLGKGRETFYLVADEMRNLRMDMETIIPPRLVREAKMLIEERQKTQEQQKEFSIS